jgi:hypothetical protein
MIQQCHDTSTAPHDSQTLEDRSEAAAVRNEIHKVPRRTAAAIALIHAGIRDHAEIASAVGLTVREVMRIDLARDPNVKRLGVDGIPPGEFFHLRRSVRCPRCSASITVAPCVTCQIRAALREEANSVLGSDADR